MLYTKLGNTGIEVSVLGMGGHEYLSDGRSRGFNENLKKSTTPGEIFEGFGDKNRLEVLKEAYDQGINFFDVTQDSEKEALGSVYTPEDEKLIEEIKKTTLYKNYEAEKTKEFLG